jgi:hypothetical protein
MLSESARMTTAAEARFRINAPNSKPRTIKVIALDRPSEAIVKRLAGLAWNGAMFLTASAFSGTPRSGEPFSMTGWLSDLAGRTTDLIAEIKTADLVVMVGTAGEDAHAASIIGDACHLHRVMTTALIVGSASKSDQALSQSLAQVRPHALMVVIANAEEYIEDMLIALRA